jgi:hypothetical protein
MAKLAHLLSALLLLAALAGCRTVGECCICLLDCVEIGKDSETIARERIARERASRRIPAASQPPAMPEAASNTPGV